MTSDQRKWFLNRIGWVLRWTNRRLKSVKRLIRRFGFRNPAELARKIAKQEKILKEGSPLLDAVHLMEQLRISKSLYEVVIELYTQQALAEIKLKTIRNLLLKQEEEERRHG